MRPTNEQRMEALRVRRSQIDAELTRLEARSRTESRKTDTRRKILIGAIVLQEVEKRPELKKWLSKLLAERLTKDRDRALFDLSPGGPANDEETVDSKECA